MSSFICARLRRVIAGAVSALLLVATACGPSEGTPDYQPPAEAQHSKFKVSGKVTYKGEPVPYGYVLFYGGRSKDAATGKFGSPALAPIKPDGSYEVHGPVIGMNFLAVATDPEADIKVLTTPVQPGGGAGPGAAPPGGLPDLPDMGGPPGPPALPGSPGGGPPMPGGPPLGSPGGGKSPAVEKLTDAQKKTLKEIHGLYGTVGMNPISFGVAGDADQTFNIELPLKGGASK